MVYPQRENEAIGSVCQCAEFQIMIVLDSHTSMHGPSNISGWESFLGDSGIEQHASSACPTASGSAAEPRWKGSHHYLVVVPDNLCSWMVAAWESNRLLVSRGGSSGRAWICSFLRELHKLGLYTVMMVINHHPPKQTI